MAFTFALPDARRIRYYFQRLPLCTRGLLVVLTAFYIGHLFTPALNRWGALVPQEINLSTLYRLNTYPLLHKNLLHFTLNSLALIPLLERFESEHGTIVTFILFSGPFGLLPGGLYTLLERYIFRLNGAAIGASVWVFLLLASESIKTYRTNPYFAIGDVKIPTWVTPIAIILVINFLVPHTSFLGHLCGALVGYLWGLGYIKFLAPPEKILRFIESKLNLLGRLPHYVSVDQKTYGRYGVLPSTSETRPGPGRGTLGAMNGVAVSPTDGGGGQRLGP
ncbi:putative rhomboid protease [Recurvomyces mirabilis]|uniref:rhomboid protease n=1 Tax=Recurvomyces mirabilis TaxID=574656 RepID=A0AAE1C3Z3_9PEZI|nr:putative rhomboid protease [Recurvomyces mirabilis]KAK5159501.1 putative rhomboid protease [Recurvomyces mirabilis]